jgi:hypothetical protein
MRRMEVAVLAGSRPKPVSPTVGVPRISGMIFPGRLPGLRGDAPLAHEDEETVSLRWCARMC